MHQYVEYDSSSGGITMVKQTPNSKISVKFSETQIIPIDEFRYLILLTTIGT